MWWWDVCFLSLGGCKVVWILGHSFVFWAEQKAAVRDIKKLGFPVNQVSIQWFGFCGLKWPGLFDRVMELAASEEHPHVMVIHAGGNDIGIMGQRELVSTMRMDVDKIC